MTKRDKAGELARRGRFAGRHGRHCCELLLRAAPNTDRDRYEEMLRQTMMLARTHPREVEAMNRRMAAAGLPPAINPFLLHGAAPSRARIVLDQERVRLLNRQLRHQQIDPTKKYMAVERRDRK